MIDDLQVKKIPKKIIKSLVRAYCDNFSPQWHIEHQFRKHQGYQPNLDNPRTYSEKLTRRKTCFSRQMTELTDKIRVRDYVAEKLGEQYLIPMYAVMDSLSAEHFDNLPNSFVLKANHGCKMNLIVQDKAQQSYAEAKRITDDWLRTRFHLKRMEFHYKPIRPRLIAEQLLLDQNGNVPTDYKCQYFYNNGKPVIYIHVVSGRFSDMRSDTFDENWENTGILMGDERPSDNPSLVTRPENLDEMLHATRVLAKPFSHVRVDLYNVGGRVYFGELTFIHGAGHMKFRTPGIDEAWGKLWGPEKN
jgi:hypothetical protein